MISTKQKKNIHRKDFLKKNLSLCDINHLINNKSIVQYFLFLHFKYQNKFKDFFLLNS